MTQDAAFTPALGRSALTPIYDRVVAAMTRERRWRAMLLDAVALRPEETVVDLGSGTGTFAVMLAGSCLDVRVIAIDPDPAVRALAEAKARAANVAITFETKLGDEPVDAAPPNTVDKVTISLVLHQCPQHMKQALLANAFALLRPGGRVFIADYGRQSTLAMRLLFHQVRLLDGYENTRANTDGMIPLLIGDAGFENVAEAWIVATPSGAISLWTGRKPSS